MNTNKLYSKPKRNKKANSKQNVMYLLLTIGMFLFSVASRGQNTIIYSQSFTNFTTPTTQCAAWVSFTGSLDTTYNYLSFKVSGSLNTTGYTVNNSAVAGAIAKALHNGTTTTQTFGGHTWNVGKNCGSGCAGGGGQIVELSMDQNVCGCGAFFSIRPAINNLNWGGFGSSAGGSGGTCNAASQTLTVEFDYGVAFVDSSLQSLAICENSGASSISSLLTANDATGNTDIWTVTTAPTNGTLSGFPVSMASGLGMTPTGLTYTPNTDFIGNDTFTIMVDNGTNTSVTTIVVTVTLYQM